MPTGNSEHDRASNAVAPAARAFLALSSDGTAELETRSPRKTMGVMALMFLVLLAAPLYWAANAQSSDADQPLAVKSNSGPSGPGGGDDDDDDDAGGDTDANDDDSGPDSVTHQGNTGPGASHHGGQGGHGGHGDDDGNDDTDNGQKSNVSNENTATNTANTGDGPNTNTKD